MMSNLEIAALNLRGLSLSEVMELVRIPGGPLSFTDRVIARTDAALSANREPVCSVCE